MEVGDAANSMVSTPVPDHGAISTLCHSTALSRRSGNGFYLPHSSKTCQERTCAVLLVVLFELQTQLLVDLVDVCLRSKCSRQALGHMTHHWGCNGVLSADRCSAAHLKLHARRTSVLNTGQRQSSLLTSSSDSSAGAALAAGPPSPPACIQTASTSANASSRSHNTPA